MFNRKLVVFMVVALFTVAGGVLTASASCWYSTIATVDGYLSGSGDEDLWSIQLTQNVRYNFRLTVAYGDDFDIWVYYKIWNGFEYEKRYVAMGIEGSGADESVYFTAPRNTKYYIEVESWVGRGSYTLTLRRRFCN